jgi:hypothetical protein
MKALVIALLLAAGCGARVEGDVIDAGGGDDVADARRPDAASIPDASPPDAQPCTGGSAQATDGATCYEAFMTVLETWAASQSVCVGRGGALVKIESAAENAIVAGLAEGARAWIGGTDLAAEGTFLWTDGTPFLTTYTNWRDGEPNNANDNFQEDCALIENGATWDDRPCDDSDPNAGAPGEYYYVCERSL